MAQYITLKKAKLNPGSHQSAHAGLWRKAWINQLRFLMFHWGTLCCTELTCHNVHWKGLCVRSVQACKKLFFTSKVYLHCLSFSTAGLLQQSQQFISIRLLVHPPFVCLSVWPPLGNSHCCFWGCTAREETKAGDADSNQPPAGSDAVRGTNTNQKIIQVENWHQLAKRHRAEARRARGLLPSNDCQQGTY